MDFSKKILAWYRQNRRELPWRNTTDPYNIWLSEIMLQQTRVAQGLPYYNKFIGAFPTVYDLARAKEDEVLKLWQGLGYYSRARNMHSTAKIIVEDYNGKFPKTHSELLRLKGVGDYTASAIASISFNKPHAVVDGNVYRVLARYFGVELPINSAEGIKYFKQLATEVMDLDEIRDYNQGIMEFGAMQCGPKRPYCLHCPLQDGCQALKKNKVQELPVKIKKGKIRKRYFNYVVVLDGAKKTLMEQRKGKGIWQGLYQFPLVETSNTVKIQEIKPLIEEKIDEKGVKSITLFNQEPVIHKLSHQHLYSQFWIVELESNLGQGIYWDKIEDLAVPVLIADFIKSFKNHYF